MAPMSMLAATMNKIKRQCWKDTVRCASGETTDVYFTVSDFYEGDLFYECLRCGESIPSRPVGSTHCKCRNIMIDVDYGRLSIEDHDKARLFRADG